MGAVHPISPHRHVGEETSIAINGEEVTIMHLPGHTECELVVYHPRSRVLFAGDAINQRAGPGHDVRRSAQTGGSGSSGSRDCGSSTIETIVPGHGELCGPEIIDEHIVTLEERIAEAV